MNIMAKNTAEIKEILGENLVTLAEYYTGDEKNLLAVCISLDFDVLQKLKKLSEIPLVLTKEELISGIDVFPIEFLNIKQHHKVLYGEDFLKNIKISKEHLRQQLEFEFRSKLIHLREDYLQFRGKEMDDLILSSVPTLSPVLGALMYLKDMRYEAAEDMFRTISEVYGIDMQVLKDIHEIKRGKAKFNKDRELYIKSLIRVMQDIGKAVDEFKVIE